MNSDEKNVFQFTQVQSELDEIAKNAEALEKRRIEFIRQHEYELNRRRKRKTTLCANSKSLALVTPNIVSSLTEKMN